MALSFRTLAAAGAMALVLSACGVNQSPPVVEAPKSQCQIEAEQFRDEVLNLPGVKYLETLTGRNLRLFLESIGAPLDMADQVIVMSHPEAPTHFVILLKDGCMVAGGEVRKSDYDKMKRGASI